MIEKTAEAIASWVRKNNPNSSSVAVLKFGVIAVINLSIVVCLVLVVAAFTGNLLDSIVASLLFPILRQFSGGMHFRSTTICNIVTAIFILIAIYTPISYWYNGFILNAFAIMLLGVFAPSGIKKSKMPKSKYPQLKLIAILIASSDFLFQSPVLALVFFIQSLTVTPIFQWMLDRRNL
jgi:accessory gene regulator B